ncbi:MAG: hypothetical protein AB7I27_08515 [Bacteriovoracaceae bacterium]
MKKIITLAGILSLSSMAFSATETLVNIDSYTAVLKGETASAIKANCVNQLTKDNYNWHTFSNLSVKFGNGEEIQKARLAKIDLDITETCNFVTYLAVASAASVSNPIENPLSGKERFLLAVRTDYSADVFTGATEAEALENCRNSKLAKMIPKDWSYGNLSVIMNSLDEKQHYNFDGGNSMAKICADAGKVGFKDFKSVK